MTNLLLRAISGILMLLLVLFVSYKGGLVLLVAIFLLSLIASFEFKCAMTRLGFKYPLSGQLILALAFILSIYFRSFGLAIFILALVFIYAFIHLALANKYNLYDMLTFIFAFLYCNFLPSFFLLFENYHQLLIVYLCSWGTDTFAYIYGMLFGRNKLIEKLSPNKTVEGSLGGSLSSVVLVGLYVAHFDLANPYLWAFLALILSIISQTGDLCASYIKRISNIKDFGNIILGHGGVLDRFDSVLFVLPFAYLFTSLFGG